MFLNDSVEESTYKTVECETKSDDCIIDSRGTMVRTFMCRSNTNSNFYFLLRVILRVLAVGLKRSVQLESLKKQLRPTEWKTLVKKRMLKAMKKRKKNILMGAKFAFA